MGFLRGFGCDSGMSEAVEEPLQPASRSWPDRGDWPIIQVYVSSDFLDMQEERDELAKNIFPRLRELCASRGVGWEVRDLHRGISDRERDVMTTLGVMAPGWTPDQGITLGIVSYQVGSGSGYFLGLLGERYGWVPETIDLEFAPEMFDVAWPGDEDALNAWRHGDMEILRARWPGEVAGRSVTELEIQHALNTAHSGISFYLRDPAYVQGKPPDQYREIPTLEETASLGAVEAERRAAERRAKLADLKKRLRSSGRPVHEDYPDPRALGEAVLADLSAEIERLYPPGWKPAPRYPYGSFPAEPGSLAALVLEMEGWPDWRASILGASTDGVPTSIASTALPPASPAPPPLPVEPAPHRRFGFLKRRSDRPR